MAPPGVLTFCNNLDNPSSPSSLLLSPFSSFSSCHSHISVFSDHNYFFTEGDNKMIKTSPEIYTRDCFDLDFPSKDKSEVMTLSEDVESTPFPSSNGDGEVSDNVFIDVTLVNRLETPVSCDTDFLQGLDDLEFDLSDCEPSRGMSLENFIDAALEDSMDASFNDHNNNSKDAICQDNAEEEEDVYRKDFFLKHLRLQRVSPRPTTSSRNRKRKHEESESNFTKPLRPSSLSLRIPDPETVGLIHPTIPPVIAATTATTTNISAPSYSNNLLTPLSVPSKLCSCASSDWKRTILYSTAKSIGVTSVQTSPSTASLSGITSYRGGPGFLPAYQSDTPRAHDNESSRLSPSLILSDKAKDCFEFDLIDNNEMDEDTKDLLRWLDNQEVQTTIAGITSSSQTSSSIPDGSTSHRHSSSSSSDIITGDDLDAILSPRSHQSSLELDTFQDLEAYVSEESTPFDTNDKKPRSDVINGSDQFPKSQIRLSILADVSKDFLNAEYKERKEAIKRDILKSCESTQLSYSTEGRDQMSERSDFIFEYRRDSPFSALSSSSSSSSPSSSPPHSPAETFTELSPSHDFISKRQSKNLDLLNLFSDENALWCL